MAIASALVAMAIASSADASWRVRSAAPFAVRGGVLAIELEPTGPPASWSDEVALRREDGVEILATIAVVLAAERPLDPSWTAPSDPIRVLSIEAYRAIVASSSSPPDAVFVALAPMDGDDQGVFSIAGSVVRPRWLDPLPPRPLDPAEPEAASLPLVEGDDRPDLASPGEWWRWELLADAMHTAAPTAPFEGVARLYALHRAELWRAGLARVRAASESVARELLELLTATVRDPLRGDADPSIAAWISEPAELTALLAILLDPSRNAASIMRSALAWMQSRTPLTVWVESDAGGQVVVAAANPLPEEVVVRCGWVESPRESPVALLVPAQQVARLRIERPVPKTPSSIDRTRGEPSERWQHALTLRLESGEWDGRLPVGPGVFPVRPPGLSFATFVPTLTLAAAQSRRIELPPIPWRSTASLRRLGARWELFIECLRPKPSPGDRVEVALAIPTSADAAGPGSAAAVAVMVRFEVDERGSITMLEGTAPGDLAAHARSHADRWRVRIELPDAWIPPRVLGERERPLEVSFARRPAAGQGRQTAVLAVPAWCSPPRVRADVGTWIDLPSPDDR